MSLGTNQTKTYLNVKEGKIYQGNTPYSFVEGYLKGIEQKDREFKGEPVKYWYVNLASNQGELYSLALPYSSGVAKSLFNSLASAEQFTKPIRIETYISREFTKVSVSIDGVRLSWKDKNLPPVKQIQVGDKIVKDDSERMSFIVNLVNEINTKI